MSLNKQSHCESPVITEVWAQNLKAELEAVSKVIKQGYTHVAMDTEFPGLTYRLKTNDKSISTYYALIKGNVDRLKPIQIGLSFTNAQGERPQPCCTWQFNLQFDAEADEHNAESLTLLKNAGVQFERLPAEGICTKELSDGLMLIGLPINPKITWVSFHGSFDFAYLAKILTGAPLPKTVNKFTELRKHLFPATYDIKMFIQQSEKYKKHSLARLAEAFAVGVDGQLHQAGADAFITSELFFKVKRNLLSDKIAKFENKLFGFSKVFSAESVEFESATPNKCGANRFKAESLARLESGYALRPMNRVDKAPVQISYVGGYATPYRVVIGSVMWTGY